MTTITKLFGMTFPLWYTVGSFSCYSLSFIYLLISIYGNIKLSKFRDQMFIQKRNTVIVFGLNITFIITMIILSLAQVAAEHFDPLTDLPFSLLSMICIWLYLYFVNIKNWIIYYKSKWTYYTVQLQWQLLINKNYAKHNIGNWYITNNYKYGNPLYISKLFGLFHGFGLLITMVCIPAYKLNLGGHGNKFILCLLTTFIAACFYIITVCKTPSFQDTFFIQWESKMHAKLSLILIIGLIINACVVAIINNPLIGRLVAAAIINSVLFALNYTSTFIILSKCKTSIIYNKQKKQPTIQTPPVKQQYGVQTCVQTCRMSTTINMEKLDIGSLSNRQKGKINKKLISLDMILLNERCVHLFMIHLSVEFSMECLLAYIEISQFQIYLKKRIIKYQHKDVKLIEFPQNIPLSSIIEQNVDEHKCDDDVFIDNAKEQAHALFNKYIANGSEFQINIPSQQRDVLVDLLDDLEQLKNRNVNLDDLFLLFESSKNEMFSLLKFSLDRFKENYQVFTEVIKIFEKFENWNFDAYSI
eukprot:265458_1